MRQAGKGRKIFQARITLILDPDKKIPKKIAKKFKKLKKTSFRHYFQPKREEIGREREKKILVPNSVHSRPRQENSNKNFKKIQKILKTSSRLYFQPKRDQIGRAREKKILVPNSVHTRPRQENSKKNSKKFKKLKNLFQAIFLAKTG